MCTKMELDQILTTFLNCARKAFGEQLKEVILFGSYARGDFREDSDIDVLLVADIKEIEVTDYAYQLSECLGDIAMEYGMVLSPIIEPYSSYLAYKDTAPFLCNARREGLPLGA